MNLLPLILCSCLLSLVAEASLLRQIIIHKREIVQNNTGTPIIEVQNHLEKFNKDYKEKIVTPLKEIIENASFFIETLDNVTALQQEAGILNKTLDKVEVSLEGSKDELELMRDDLKSQVHALSNLAQESENLSAEGESIIVEMMKEQVQLEKEITESEKELEGVSTDLKGTEVRLQEYKAALEESTKKMAEAEYEMKKTSTLLEAEKKYCLMLKVGENLFGFGKGRRSAHDDKKDSVNGLKLLALVGALIVQEKICRATNKHDIADATVRFDHAKANLENTKKSLADTTSQAEKIKSKKNDLIAKIDRINNKKNEAAQAIWKIQNQTSLTNLVQSNLKKYQKEISDLQVKLEAFTKSVEIDLLRQGIEVVANVTAELVENALEHSETQKEKDKLIMGMEKLKKKKQEK